MDRIPLSCRCGIDFFFLPALSAHVSVHPACLQFWGGDNEALEKKVKSIRNAATYQKNRKKIIARSVVNIWHPAQFCKSQNHP